MKASIIKSFSIYGLFGTTDVHIPFEEDIKILVGENGIGKTQVLNIFYYVITSNFNRLLDAPFSSLEIIFENKESLCLSRSKIWFSKTTTTTEKTAPNIINGFPYLQAEEYYTPSEEYHTFESQINKLLKDYKTIYFPTFRRIEEDLHNLGYDEKAFKSNTKDEQLVHFGMKDVQTRFNDLEDKIDSYLKDGFAKISSEILTQLVKGFAEIDQDVLNKIDQKDLDIILARAGKQVAESDKEKIRQIVADKDFSTDKNNLSLLYFLQKLTEIYKKQRELDDSIKIFRNVCNKYLVNKEIFYDESAIKIYVKSNINEQEIPLSKLSSGEKQIISIFTKMYLAQDDQHFIVLFDEPELSLSMIWQKQLLPDIINSGRCKFLLAVTHSPFIFDNELDKYAMGLSEYISYPQTELTLLTP